MKTVTLYSRKDCHLCERVEEVLKTASGKVSFTLQKIDIDSDPALVERYGAEIPVVAIDGADSFRHHLNLDAFLKRLAQT